MGNHPQPVRYYLALAGQTFRMMFDMAMIVLGSALVGLAIAVLLVGLGLFNGDLQIGIGALLGSALVLGVVGGFAFGLASEGGFGSSYPSLGFPTLEVIGARILFGLAISVLLLVFSGPLGNLVLGLPFPMRAGVELVRATGLVGIAVSAIGVPLAWYLRTGLERIGLDLPVEMPTIYVVWVLAILFAFQMPGV